MEYSGKLGKLPHHRFRGERHIIRVVGTSGLNVTACVRDTALPVLAVRG